MAIPGTQRIRRSIVAQLAVSASAVAVVLVALAVAALVESSLGKAREALDAKAWMAAQMVAPPVAEAVWSLDPRRAAAGLGALAELESFSEALVLGSRGELFHATSGFGARLETPADVLERRIPLAHEDRQGNLREIGTLVVRFGLERTWESARREAYAVVGIGAAVMLVVVLLLVRLARSIVDPVVRITGLMSDLAAGDVSIDVSGRHREDEIGRMAVALQTFVENAVDLKAAKECAERAMADKARFIAAASHDLRQPVQSLVLFSGMLQGKSRNHPEIAETCGMISAVVTNLRNLTDNLMDLSRLDAGGVGPRVEALDAGDLLRSLGAQFTPVALGKGIALQVEPIETLVRSDKVLLMRLIGNLIDNAIRYTRQGSVTVRCMAVAGQLRIEVADTGIGIDAANLEAIWGEFYQVGNPERNRDNGLGLGLSIVKRLSGLLGHPVELRSVPGQGSCFTVTVPIAAGPAGTGAEPAMTRAPVASGAFRILVVEDDRMVREALCAFLAEAGIPVLGVGSAAEASDAAPAFSPDAVITDFNLPGEDGIALVGRLRAELGYEIPAAVISGSADKSIETTATSEGIHFAMKPIDPDRVREILARLSTVTAVAA